jgi:hypothetical protein
MQFLGLLGLAMLVNLVYVSAAARLAGPGFPLDDAWIHQTYARNLALRGEWAFLPGVPSAGSTAPLWTVVLALGYRLGVDPYVWALAWGSVLLAVIGWVGWHWLEARAPGMRGMAWLAGVLLVVEWHLAWASASGMETLAQALVVLLTFYGLERRWPPFALGLLIGAGVWIRPDAAVLLLAVGWCVVVRGQNDVVGIARRSLAVAGGLAVLAVPYVGFNLLLSGHAWPSTFYAKQAEYASLLGQPLGLRVLQQWGIGLVGAGALLVPGLALSVWRDVSGRRWDRLAPGVWWLAFLMVYAIRLPVTYQHGRYAMPVLPVLVVLGLETVLAALSAATGRVPRVVSRAWAVACGVVAVAFLALGARAYGQDVAVIQTEMVATAIWIEANTAPDDLIAAHDIGAVGYFARRRLLDLAGLISPEALPFLRDEAALEAYLSAKGADYLMTFPGWYPRLVEGRTPVYQADAPFAPASGGENMAVYAW